MTDETKIKESKTLLTTKLPVMEGWLTPERAHEMYDLICRVQPDVVVEIGVFGGRSLITQALALRDVGKGHIIGIDPWKKEEALSEIGEAEMAWWNAVDYHKIHSGCVDTIWELGLDHWVTIIRAASQDCVWMMPKIDILYIDGNHTEAASCRDVELYLPKVKQNGWVWADDMDWASTRKARQMLVDSCKVVNDNGNYMLLCKP